jgi:hypothetical protein
LFLALLGCQVAPERRAQELETPLSKLTPAVLAVVRYPDSPGPVADDQLLAEAMKDKPELREAFRDVPIKVWHDDHDVILMVCSPDGKYCWLEDASWTLGVDRRCYQSKPPVPAEFTLAPPPRKKDGAQTRPTNQPAGHR